MHASGGGRGKTKVIIEHDTSERWMASYMDMVTVLMCLFIVLFAMSTVDAKKFSELKNSLATGFGVTQSDTVDTASGIVVPENMVDENGDLIAVSTDATEVTDIVKAQVEQLKQVQSSIEQELAAQGLSGKVQFFSDERGIGIRLLGDQTYFASGSANMSTEAMQTVDAIGHAVAASGRSVQIEGHADNRAISGTYASNWELSSARATAVLRRMVESDGVDPAKIGAVGYGSARPLSAGTTDADLALNRRVDIVILTDENDPAVTAAVAAAMNGDAASADTASTDTASSDGHASDTKSESSTSDTSTKSDKAETSSDSGSHH